MRRAWGRSELWLVESAHEEWMVDPLDCPDFAGGIGAGNSHPVFARNVLQLGRQPVRARGVLDHTLGAVQLGEQRPRRQPDCDPLVLKRTFEQGDDRAATRAVLGMAGIRDSGEVPSVLDQHVLKTASSADERYAPLARFPYDGMSRLRIAVRGARPDYDHRSSGGDP